MQFTKHFNSTEFDSPDSIASGLKMNEKFILRLENARVFSGVPYVINSGYRTRAHNKKVGGTKNSSHLKGRAVDIVVSNSLNRYLILGGLLKAGFRRIGIGKKYIHVDTGFLKVPNLIWLYK